MSQEHLGFFDTPPDRRDVRFSVAIVGVVFAAFLLTLPVAGVRLLEINSFVPVVDAMMCLGDLIAATLLYAQASVFRSRALTALATAYLYTALLLVPHALTFPGAFALNGLLGAGVSTPSWLGTFRRLAFPIVTILYVRFKRVEAAAQPRPERPAEKIGVWVFGAVAFATAVTVLAIGGHDLLPPYYVNRSDLIHSNVVGYESVVFALYAVAAAVLFRNRSSVLDMWVLVAFGCWLIQSLLIFAVPGRFTLGFYSYHVMTLFSHLVVMLALIAESNRLYARLALATSARIREREARLMTLDTVAAAISHEVGQPLTAIGLHTSVGLKRLTGAPPDVGTAIQAQRDTIEALRCAQDVLKSIRSMFTQQPASPTEFSLNELVSATTSLMARELAAEKVSLQLVLDGSLPPIQADRVQIQRVLVNLITNAIESLGATRGRSRRITIRSTPVGAQDVLLEVSDNGVGIAPEKMGQIFDTFFTTKPAGTGLGLSLCRITVEAFGGHLWASSSDASGATFHLQLPRSRLSEA